MAEPMERSEELIEAGPVRPLPVRAQGRTIEIWGREVGPLAVARASRAPRRPPRRGLFRRREKVVASRSFLVDVHILGR